MLGYISSGASYDPASDLFVGADDPKSLATATTTFSGLTHKRYRVNNRAALLMTVTDPSTGKHIYAAYFAAASRGSHVVYIAFLPPGNSSEIGDFVWDKLRSNLENAGHQVAVAHDIGADAATQDAMGAQSFAESSIESQGAKDRDVASAVEAAVKTARTLGFYYDASKSSEGQVVVRAKWQEREVTLTLWFHRKASALYLSSRTSQGGDTLLNGGGQKIERLFYSRMHAETERRKLQIYADHLVF